jgi:hypothetical protein
VEPILQLSPWYIVTGRDSPVKAAWSTSIYLIYDMIILNNLNKNVKSNMQDKINLFPLY